MCRDPSGSRHSHVCTACAGRRWWCCRLPLPPLVWIDSHRTGVPTRERPRHRPPGGQLTRRTARRACCRARHHRGRRARTPGPPRVRHQKSLGPLPWIWDRHGNGSLPSLRDSWEIKRATGLLQLDELLDAAADGATLMLDLKGVGDVGPAVVRALHARSPKRTGHRLRALVAQRRRVHRDASGRKRCCRRVTRRELTRPAAAACGNGPAPYGVSIHMSLLDRELVDELRCLVEVVMTWPSQRRRRARASAERRRQRHHLRRARRLAHGAVEPRELTRVDATGAATDSRPTRSGRASTGATESGPQHWLAPGPWRQLSLLARGPPTARDAGWGSRGSGLGWAASVRAGADTGSRPARRAGATAPVVLLRSTRSRQSPASRAPCAPGAPGTTALRR
jgi:hypothetical protein